MRETARERMKAGEKFVLNTTEGGVHFPKSVSWWLTQEKDMISTEHSVHKKVKQKRCGFDVYSLFTFPICAYFLYLFSKFHLVIVQHNGSFGGERLSSNKCGKGRVGRQQRRRFM